MKQTSYRIRCTGILCQPLIIIIICVILRLDGVLRITQQLQNRNEQNHLHVACSDDLVEAMTAAKKEIDGDTEMEAEDDSDGGEAEMPVDATVDERKQIYVLNLVDAGYDETLVIRSLQYVDPEDVTAGENIHSYLRN